MKGRLNRGNHAALGEEFAAFWDAVKEGGKTGEYGHFKVADILGGHNDWSLGIKMDGIDREIYRRTKEPIVDGIMDNGPYTGHGSTIVLPVMKVITNAVHRQGFTVNDMEVLYTRSSVMHTHSMGGQIMGLAQCTDDDKHDFVAVTLTFWKSDLDLEMAGENIGIIVRTIDEARKQPTISRVKPTEEACNATSDDGTD
ncbi:MAG: hypothetical protein CL878_02870 [Dehalococcoidia bacterium]|nr:hypothetical protein [Dehalococcoidia bacterium]